MHRSYDEILDLSVSELLYWQVYYSIYPFDDTKDYYLNANILAMLYNVNRGGNKKAATPADFLPTFMQEPNESSVSQTIKLLKLVHEGKQNVLRPPDRTPSTR